MQGAKTFDVGLLVILKMMGERPCGDSFHISLAL